LGLKNLPEEAPAEEKAAEPERERDLDADPKDPDAGLEVDTGE
jgi:hypothetical protein